ncbi:hypothetical protein B0T14DRAFT_604193 [Immersiella caudata]|uniref:Uncharacterized protein n=1 Tax=Immersiella caudata TaxID=314043 RepID=A0AA39WS80_9PEZI|nr:hypothetical protein B0T14DRAFT_604193 [Immersiella caudata]
MRLMRLSSLLASLIGGASLTIAAPQPLAAPRQLNEIEMAEIHARGYNATLQKRADWALIGFSGRDCTGNLAFGYVGSATTNCQNTNFAQSVGMQNEYPLTPEGYTNDGCGNVTPFQYVRELGPNYWCLNGDVRSFKAIRYIDGK